MCMIAFFSIFILCHWFLLPSIGFDTFLFFILYAYFLFLFLYIIIIIIIIIFMAGSLYPNLFHNFGQSDFDTCTNKIFWGS